MVKIEELESYNEQKQERNIEVTDDEVIRVQFRFLGLFGKKYNIVIYIRKSAGKTAKFKKLIERMVPINNRTR
jgi:hypothetical protein